MHFFKVVLIFIVLFFYSVAGFSEPKNDLELDSVVVTANKQKEDVGKVPVSMSVFTSIDLEDRMLETIDDMARFTPGLDVGDYGAALKRAPSMRGLYSDYSSRSSSTGLYVDGVPVLDGTGFDQVLCDVERVEVLKGPQGTLYGKNSEVGVINVITKKPTNDITGRLSFSTGSDNKKDLSFNVSGPLVQNLFFLGVSGKIFEQDGFIENPETNETLDDRAHNYGKINMSLQPSDRLNADLTLSKIRYDDGANRADLMLDADRKINSNMEQYNRSTVSMASLNVSYRFNNKFSLNSVTTHRLYNEKNANDFDYSPQTIFHVKADSDYKNESQEFRLNYNGSKLKGLLGVYLDQGDTDINRVNTFKGGWQKFVNQDEESNSLGLFTHLTWALTDKLNILGGLRYDFEKKDYEDAGKGVDSDDNWNEISPKFALTYQYQENLMFYSNIAKGYRSGGFNTWSPQGYPLSYDEETLWSYEIGTKTSFLNKRLLFNFSLYYMDIDDMQVDVYINPEDLYKTNAAKGTSQGFETEVKLKVSAEWLLFAGLSYNDCRFDEYKDAKGDYKDNHSLFAPEYNFNIGFQYRNNRGFYASADIVGYGETYYDRENEYSRDPYELVNFKTGFEMGNCDIYFYGKNIFDEEYDSDGLFSAYTTYSKPREIGMNLTYRF